MRAFFSISATIHSIDVTPLPCNREREAIKEKSEIRLLRTRVNIRMAHMGPISKLSCLHGAFDKQKLHKPIDGMLQSGIPIFARVSSVDGFEPNRGKTVEISNQTYFRANRYGVQRGAPRHTVRGEFSF